MAKPNVATRVRSKSELSAPPLGHSVATALPDEEVGQDFVLALARGLSVIRAFAYQRDKLTLSEVSRLVGLSRATVRRCLLTLTALDYIQTDGKYFSLTPMVLTLSQAYFSSNSLSHIARPYIEQVSATIGESCSISVLAGDEVIYVARSSRKRAASVHREVGVNLPAYCTSMGRVLLASLSPEALDSYLNRVSLKKFNSKTVTDPDELRAILARVRDDDYATIDGELEPNLRAIAVPVRNISGTIVAAAHVSSDVGRATTEKLRDDYLPVLQNAVAQIRRGLVG
jgi:IclR family pca regulon transcriptional regulator